MIDKNTSSSAAQPARLPANPSFEHLTERFRRYAETPIVAVEIEAMQVTVPASGRFDLIAAMPSTHRHGLAAVRPNGTYDVRLGFGLSEEEAGARAAELKTTRAATGYHLWS